MRNILWALLGPGLGSTGERIAGRRPAGVEGTTGISHDLRGNVTAGNLTYDAFNRLTNTGSNVLTYATPDNNELVTDGTTSH